VPESLFAQFLSKFLDLELSTSDSVHFFTQSLSSFRSTCPYHRNLFYCSTEIMSSNSSLSLNPLLGTLSCSLTPHIHLTILISAHSSTTSFSFLMGQVSLPCNILLHTQLVYNLPLTINDISLLVSNWYLRREFIPSIHSFIHSFQFEFWSLQLHQHPRLHST